MEAIGVVEMIVEEAIRLKVFPVTDLIDDSNDSIVIAVCELKLD
jgi:hypothetical protein